MADTDGLEDMLPNIIYHDTHASHQQNSLKIYSIILSVSILTLIYSKENSLVLVLPNTICAEVIIYSTL